MSGDFGTCRRKLMDQPTQHPSWDARSWVGMDASDKCLPRRSSLVDRGGFRSQEYQFYRKPFHLDKLCNL